MIKPRLIWLVGHVERMGEMRNAYKVLGLKHKGKSLMGYIGINDKVKKDDDFRFS
jgi:hypothetical protein